jgi:FdhD protein
VPAPVVTGRQGDTGAKVRWHLAEEAAIAILLNGASFAVMLGTPRDLEDFALGFLFTERIIGRPGELKEIRILDVEDGVAVNCLVDAAALAEAESRRRTLTGRSGCGLCGAETLGAALPKLTRVNGAWPSAERLQAAFERLPKLQPLNAMNRSMHAAAFFGRDSTEEIAREDIGRHNALDKVAGAMLRAGVDPGTGFGLLSSRMSVELVQKAVVLGLPFLASVSAPTDLALRVAGRSGLGVAALAGDTVMFFGRGAPTR